MRVEHTFFLPVEPHATQRTRCACRGRYPTVYNDRKYKEWRAQAVPKLIEIASTEDFRAVRESPVEIETEAIAARPKTTKLVAPKWDIDNVEKGLWDAITKSKGWWKDDKQIVHNRTTKRWAEEGETPGYLVTIRFLGDTPYNKN